MSDDRPWREVEEQLAELNALAARNLPAQRIPHEPEPPGLPSAGSWVRAIEVDLDGHPKDLTPWHYVVGWDEVIGCLSTRCRRQPGQSLRAATAAHLGRPWRNYRGRALRARLLVSPGAPAEACRQCEVALARDSEAAVAIERQRTREGRLALLPEIEAIAADASIDDAERGRRLRDLWQASR